MTVVIKKTKRKRIVVKKKPKKPPVPIFKFPQKVRHWAEVRGAFWECKNCFYKDGPMEFDAMIAAGRAHGKVKCKTPKHVPPAKTVWPKDKKAKKKRKVKA